MASYFIPTKAILNTQVFSPAQIIADTAFDAWLKDRNYDFVEKFSTAFRAGQTSFDYVYVSGTLDEVLSAKYTSISYLKDVLTGYGYTISDISTSGTTTWKFTMTLPQVTS